MERKKMKILHMLSGGSVGGIETLCLDIAELSKDQHEFCFLFQGGAIAEEMEQKGYPVYFYYEKNPFMRLKDLVQLVRKEAFDAVIVHHEGVGIYAFYLALCSLFRRTKFIKYLHCSFEREYFYTGKKTRDKLYYYLLKKTLNRSEQLVAVSAYVKESYCHEFGCDPAKVEVIYNGIGKAEERDFTRSLIKQEEGLQLLYMGRLVSVKGVDRLFYAMKLLLDKGERLTLEILGDGPERNNLEKWAEELGIIQQVRFRGFQRDKGSYWRNSQIFVYPSVWQEAFGISIVEAMAHGMICVAANTGGIPEIISNGENGFLYENDKENKNLADALARAIDLCRSEEYPDMAARSRERAMYFDIQKTVSSLECVYRKERRNG